VLGAHASVWATVHARRREAATAALRRVAKGLTIMKSTIIRACLAIAALTAAPFAAQAADMPSREPIYSAPSYFSWTGFYVGLNGGYGWGKSNWSGGGGTFEVSPNGWLGGGTLGYNLQTGAWVWGIEGDIDYVNLKGTADAAFCPTCTFKDTWLGTLRGRVGYSFDRLLPYLTGGLAYGNMNMETGVGSVSRTKAGWTAGAGLEYAFAGYWSTKLEYLYVDLGSATCGMASCGFATDETVNFKASMVRLGLNYRF
jgi:outer membrane immunogenic protein